ncbi:MAG: TrkH family potassium uptake protein [Gammaproteobacteria bacterium]|jgi:trk system potassium uptake protein TrkH
MQFATIRRVLGVLMTIYAFSMIPPMLVSLWYQDGEFIHFLESFGIMAAVGLAVWLPVRGRGHEMRRREGFLIVTLFWVLLSALSSLPLHLGAHVDYTDAFFESVSGFTTTGATVIVGLDHLPKSILYYRQQLNWLGGMGIVVLAIAILPMLRIGGMQLYRAETPGPMKDDKLTPRIAHTAQALWVIYMGLTVACAIGYWIAGMTPFDAVGHAFATIATGGFSTHDASFAYFHNPYIEAVGDVFMLLSGMNFAIHYLAIRKVSMGAYWRDEEVRAYLVFILGSILLVSLTLWFEGTYHSPLTALRYGAFQVLTVMTSTGFVSTNFSGWPIYVPAFLMLIAIIGGCAGSTSGGMKMVRVLLGFKQGVREFRRLQHPRAEFPVKFNGRVLPERVISAVWSFLAAYVIVYVLLMLALMAAGLDQVSAFSAVAACINNMGPGLGQVATNFAGISDAAKWILSFAMLLGRLELFTLLMLFMPGFWRD